MVETRTLVPVEEYLNTTYKPACEYRDGVLTQKPMPTSNHGLIQLRLGQILLNRYSSFVPSAELIVGIAPARFLVPDLGVQSRETIQHPYPMNPIHLCVEILSPGDRLSDTLAKCEEYHAWGVPTTWIIDPDERRAWEYRAGHRLSDVPQEGSLTAEPIRVSLAELFEVL
jgi:Uma2 family endonuclease